MKKPKFWLARDPKNEIFAGCYSVGFGKKPTKDKRDGDFWGDVLLTQEKFERLAPKSVHLKPGEGPIQIDISMRRVKK